MKVAILAGGFGTRISEETSVRPKPMVEIGGRPILWHIMKMYAHHGLTDFVILGGFKIDYIRDYFLNYTRASSDFTIDLHSGELIWQRRHSEAWRVTVLDTGLETMMGGRMLRAAEHLRAGPFCLTYGDGVSDVPIDKLLAFHHARGRACTVTAVAPPGRFGVLGLDASGEQVLAFREKDQQDVGLINGGFFVCQPEVLDVIEGDASVWEQGPLDALVKQGQLSIFRHRGFWQAMDTLRDRMVLERLWESGRAPWKVWD